MTSDSQSPTFYAIRRKNIIRKPLHVVPETLPGTDAVVGVIGHYPTGTVFVTDDLRIAASIVVNGGYGGVSEIGVPIRFALVDFLEPFRLLVFGELNDGEIEVFDLVTGESVEIDANVYRVVSASPSGFVSGRFQA
jgi:hypothetical protein|nr:hypothetical protein [Neorhizobium tomejilense]